MSWLQIAALVIAVAAGLVAEASRLAARQEAKARRHETPEVTLHPAPDLDRLWGPQDSLPGMMRTMTRLHRAATTVAFVAGAVLLLTLVFGK